MYRMRKGNIGKGERLPELRCSCPPPRNVTNTKELQGAAPKEKKKGSCLKTVLIALGILFLIGIIGSALGGKDSKKEETPAQGEQETEAPKDENTPSESKEEAETKKEEKDKYSVGDTWENKYVLVSFDECGEYVSDNEFIQPADGNKFIYAKFTFENIGSSDTTVAYWDFDCYADGYACEGTYGADDSGFTQTLSSGRKISGSIYFEVPENVAEIEFEFSPSFWTSEKVVFVYE